MYNKFLAPEAIIGGVVLLIAGGGAFVLISGEEKEQVRATAPTPFVEIVRPSGFVNTDGITIGELVGEKVILVDFMTYSCINCQRTFPYLNDWYAKYKDKGLEIIGIHTPEFAFERDIENVRAAAEEFGLAFPIVLDNEYATWGAYQNRYWPRKYLIDIYGNIVYDHIGEGAYEETEARIVALLNERARVRGEGGQVVVMGGEPEGVVEVDFSRVRTPETYLGRARIQYLINLPNRSCLEGSCTYSFSNLENYQGYELRGKWRLDTETATLESDTGAIRISFTASAVHIVAGAPSGAPVSARVFLDGEERGVVSISNYGLYTLIDLDGEYGTHTLEIQFEGPGVSAFAFTFG